MVWKTVELSMNMIAKRLLDLLSDTTLSLRLPAAAWAASGGGGASELQSSGGRHLQGREQSQRAGEHSEDRGEVSHMTSSTHRQQCIFSLY